MKVLLIQSYLGPGEAPVFPIGLASLAAALKDSGHEVSVFDQNTSRSPWEELETRVRGFVPDVAGISIRNIDSTNKRRVVFYYPMAKRAISILKQACPASKIIAGGSGFSMFAREIMADEPGIDFGVYLEGERTLPALLDHLQDPERVPGVFHRNGGEIRFSGSSKPEGMDSLPLPDRDILDPAPYAVFQDAFGVETKRGCPLGCVYCIYGFLNGKRYRFRKPDLVVDDIERLVQDTGAARFTFVDSIFNVPLSHAEAICREIVRRRLKTPWSAWFCETSLTPEFVALAKEAGCDHMIFSPDGFADSTLKKLGKTTTTARILAAYKVARDSGLRASYNFFKNPPGQCAANFFGMVFFVLRAKLQMRGRAGFEFSSLRIEPHTGLHEIAVGEGILKGGENLLYPVNYTQRRTRFLEQIFDAGLRLKGR